MALWRRFAATSHGWPTTLVSLTAAKCVRWTTHGIWLAPFPLWYVRNGLGRRSDVAVVDRSLLAFDWYRAELKWQHPDWAGVAAARNAGEAVAALVLQEWPRLPIHLLDADEALLQLADWRREAHFFTLAR